MLYYTFQTRYFEYTMMKSPPCPPSAAAASSFAMHLIFRTFHWEIAFWWLFHECTNCSCFPVSVCCILHAVYAFFNLCHVQLGLPTIVVLSLRPIFASNSCYCHFFYLQCWCVSGILCFFHNSSSDVSLFVTGSTPVKKKWMNCTHSQVYVENSGKCWLWKIMISWQMRTGNFTSNGIHSNELRTWSWGVLKKMCCCLYVWKWKREMTTFHNFWRDTARTQINIRFDYCLYIQIFLSQVEFLKKKNLANIVDALQMSS